MIERSRRFWLLAMACAWMPAAAQTRLLPVDEAPTVPDFFSFRARLQTAVARHDLAALRAVLHPQAKLSFGGDVGLEGLKTIWQPESPDTQLWTTLAQVLALGGSFGGAPTSFTAPYVFTIWPPGLDAYDHAAALGTGVRVRSAPSAQAAAVSSLDFAIVELVPNPASPNQDWTAIKLPGGRTGYVDSLLLRSPIDYRARFEKLDGRWQMTMFLAGD
jgi:hypothetical protein